MKTSLLTIQDAANQLRCHENTVRGFVKKRWLKAIKRGAKFLRFTQEEIDAFIRRSFTPESGKAKR
jgi:excisionase family DNA binding protein